MSEIVTRRISLLAAIVIMIGAPLLGFFTLGFAGVLFSVSFVGGLILWILTTYGTPVDPQKIIVPYLVTVIFFILHVYEEYSFHIEVLFSKLSGVPVTQGDFLTVAAFASVIVWLLGAVLMLKRWSLGYFFASSFLFGMMFAVLSHPLFPFMENGRFHYVAGLYTFFLPALAGWYTFFVMMRERKKIRTARKEERR